MYDVWSAYQRFTATTKCILQLAYYKYKITQMRTLFPTIHEDVQVFASITAP